MEIRKRVPDHELSHSSPCEPTEPGGVKRRSETLSGSSARSEIKKVEGESPLSPLAPSTMGVSSKRLGPLTGPNEEMAHEALMEGWSRKPRTYSFASHLSSSTAPHTDPATGRRAVQPLGSGKSRARFPDIEGPGRLRLDIDFYGRRHSVAFSPLAAPRIQQPRGFASLRVAFPGGLRHP